MSMFKIYKITNKINGKIYVGYTSKSLESRFKKHISSRNEGNIKFRRAIKKYGQNNFMIELLQECDTKESALLAEIYHISALNSYYSGYNSTLGGEPQPTIKPNSFSSSSRRKKSDSFKKWFETEEGIQFKKAASERFKKLNPSRFVTSEHRKIAKEKYQKWLLTDSGIKRRQESSENMRKVQKMRHVGIFELSDPTGKCHTTHNILRFCKDHNLSYHSFYFSLKISKKKEINKMGKNKGWKVLKWNYIE